MILSLLLAWALLPVFPRLAEAESPQQPPRQPSSNDNDLCSYLKDVQAKTDADCGQEVFAALKSRDPAAYSQKLELARKRKPDVLKVYELLKARPSPPDANKPNQSALPQLDPPINERTFPAWIGPEAKDLKDIYTRWLQAQTQELQEEKENPLSPERGKEIEAALAANQAKITALGKINDPGEFRCFLGEACGTKSELSDPSGHGVATGNGSWTKSDYERANAEARRQNLVPGGKLSRGVPALGTIASEVAANTPLGPLTEKPADDTHSDLRTVAAMALATTGALLLFGGLGGKALEEKFPNIRRDMGIAAGISGVIAVGAISLRTLLPVVVMSSPALPAVEQKAADRSSQILSRLGTAAQNLSGRASSLGPQSRAEVQALSKAPEQIFPELQTGSATLERIRNLLAPGGQRVGREGSSNLIRIMDGTVQDAEGLFAKLTRGAKVIPHPRQGPGGKFAELPNGGYLGLRYVSKSGSTTIDVNVAGVNIKEIKFVSP